MRLGLILALTIAVATAAAHAGSSVTITPMGGSIGVPFDDGLVHGFTYEFPKSLPPGSGPPFNLYDNIPTFFGGTSDDGVCGPFTVPCSTYAFLDWDEPSAHFGDDLHQVAFGSPGPAVVTALWYGYLNTFATSTHVVRIYDMVPPSIVPTTTTLVDKGELLASIVLPAQPFGSTGFAVTVTGLSVVLPHSAVWIKFSESGTGTPGTSWLTGGIPGIGYSHPGLNRTIKNPVGIFNTWMQIPYFSIYNPNPGGSNYVISNIAVGLNGYVPGPGAIGVLGLGGLLVLRRRRGGRA